MPSPHPAAVLRALLLTAATPAIAQLPPPAQQQQILTSPPAVDFSEADVLTWSSPVPDAINVHLARAPGGTVLFDALRRSDQVEELFPLLEATGGRPAAVLVTHAHTDHYGGLPFLRDRYPDLPIYGTEAIATEIREDEWPDNENRRAMFGIRFATQAELDENLPTEFVADGEAFEVAGLRIVPYVMGASESPAAVVYHLPDVGAAVVGDLVNVLTISAPMVSLGEWLAQLDRLAEVLPAETTLYVGHGPSGPAGRLLADQRAYLELLRGFVAEAASDGQGVSDAETEEIVWRMRVAYPHHRGAAFLPPEELIAVSVGWVAEQLTGDRRR